MVYSANMTSEKKPPRAVFVAATTVFFFLGLSAADSVGFVPYYVDGTAPAPKTQEVALADLPQLGDLSVSTTTDYGLPTTDSPVYLPSHISIPSIALNLPVYNPKTKNDAALDEVLLKGPARYVDSAKLGEAGNMLIFAHSSHLPVVHNQMFKAFNRLPELKEGDSITVSGEGHDFLYRVTRVYKTDANDAIIDLSKNNGTHLTLSTCDNFGAKTSRWVVEAEFIGTNE